MRHVVSKLQRVDCPKSGPGPRGPGSGPDRSHRSEGPGQWEVDRTSILTVQVRDVSGPDLGVGPGSDLDRTSIFQLYSIYKILQDIIIELYCTDTVETFLNGAVGGVWKYCIVQALFVFRHHNDHIVTLINPSVPSFLTFLNVLINFCVKRCV